MLGDTAKLYSPRYLCRLLHSLILVAIGLLLEFEASLKIDWCGHLWQCSVNNPDSKVRGANMGPTWVLSAPDWPHLGPTNLAIREIDWWYPKLYSFLGMSQYTVGSSGRWKFIPFSKTSLKNPGTAWCPPSGYVRRLWGYELIWVYQKDWLYRVYHVNMGAFPFVTTGSSYYLTVGFTCAEAHFTNMFFFFNFNPSMDKLLYPLWNMLHRWSWEWITDFIPPFAGHMIIYSCCDWS